MTLGPLAGLSQAGPPQIATGEIPASIRDGTPDAKRAYAQGLEFERVLVNQLAQQLAGSVSGAGEANGSDGSSQTAGTPDYSSFIQQALTQGISSTGGLGVAMEIARALDPSLGTRAPGPAAGAPR